MGLLLIPSWTIKFNWDGRTGSGQFCVNILTLNTQCIAFSKDMNETRYSTDLHRFFLLLKNQFDPCRMGLDLNIQRFPASLKKEDMTRLDGEWIKPTRD